MNWTSWAAFFLALAVVIGAFGAHALDNRLDEYAKGVFETGVKYHFYHALGMLMVSLMPRVKALSEKRMGIIAALLAVGIVIFSGSLYALAISGNRMLGAITPIGGVSFIAAWILLAFWTLRKDS